MRLILVLVALGLAPESFARSWEELLAKTFSSRLGGARVALYQLKAPRALSPGTRIHRFTPEQPVGFVSFEAEVNGQAMQGSVQVRAYRPIAIAKESLSHGDRLGADQVAFEERELSPWVRGGYFTAASDLEKRVVRGVVPAGAVLTKTNTQPTPWIVQGEAVDLVRRRGKLKLSARVRALQGGSAEQWIQVQNISSGKLLLAKITAPGEVEVR